MKKILILFRVNAKKSHKIFEILKSELDNKNTELIANFEYTDIKIERIKDQQLPKLFIGGNDLDEFQKVVMYTVQTQHETLASIIANYCILKKIEVINSREKLNFNGGKLLQKILLPFHNVPTGRFFFQKDLTTLDYETIVEKLGSTFVAKQTHSSLGRGVELISSKEEYTNFLKGLPQRENKSLWFFEEYIPHEYSVRGIVTGKNCNIKITVQKENNRFQTNHGEASFSTDIDPVFAQMCVNAASAMKLEISGVDTVFDQNENKFKVLEVNKSPGFTINDKNLELKALANFLAE